MKQVNQFTLLIVFIIDLVQLSSYLPCCIYIYIDRDGYLTLDVDECASQPCHGNSYCTDEINSYHCTCQAHFTGQNCEIG